MKILEIIIRKLSSGKFWLTIIAGFAFKFAVENKILEPAAISSIVTAVFMSYFQRKESDNA